jgi:hypothetical protein
MLWPGQVIHGDSNGTHSKTIQKGQNQAVMLPAEFAFDTESVYIRRDEEGMSFWRQNLF